MVFCLSLSIYIYIPFPISPSSLGQNTTTTDDDSVPPRIKIGLRISQQFIRKLIVDVTPTSCFTFDRESPSTARNVFATPIVLILALTPTVNIHFFVRKRNINESQG